MTQEELAHKINYENKSTVSDLENGNSGYSGAIVSSLAEVFNTTTDYILLGVTEDSEMVEEVIQILRGLKTSKAQRAAVECLRAIKNMEE